MAALQVVRSGLRQLIRRWRTDDPTQLEHQLITHQQDVDDALQRLGQRVWPRLVETAVATGSHRVRLGELLLVDTAAGNASVVLPEISGAILGQIVGVKKISPANSVRISVPRGRVDGASTLQRRGLGLTVWVATSHGWQSVGGYSDGPSDATPQPIGTPGAGTSDLYSRADHVHGMPTAAAHSLLTTGGSAGRVESVVTLGENEILGRAQGGTLGGASPQSFVFAGGGNLTLRVAPDSSAPITSLADSSQRNYIYSFADGYYHVTISAIAKESTSGIYHDAGALVGVVSESGDLTIVRETPLPGSGGLTLDFDVDEDDLVVTLGNETGDAATGRLHVGWMRQDLIP